jgi:hypothetical protein
MTLVIEIEERSKVSLRSRDEFTVIGGACRTSDASGRFKYERRRPTKKRDSEDGHTETSKCNNSEDERDFHKPHVMMTVIDTSITCAPEAPTRRVGDSAF